MFQKIIAFFMSIISFFSGLFGFSAKIDCYEYKNLSYGTHERHTLNLNIPKNTDGHIGLVLFIHGGAWVAGDKEAYEDDMQYTSKTLGYASASINYRYISDEVNLLDILDDIDMALECIKAKGLENGIDINKVLITGSSAGGHLSLLYAYERGKNTPITTAAVVSNCGPTDFTDENFYINNSMGDEEFMSKLFSYACGYEFTYAEREKAKDALKAVSPVTYVSESCVPTVINHGMKDTIVPYSNALTLDKALSDCGVTHVLNSYPNSNHGLSDDKQNSKMADKLFEEYVNTYLG